MDQPQTTRKAPFVLELAAGTYWWCACGRSKTQPFCDGSHKDSAFTPVKFEQAKAGQVALCGCKRTKTPPYCDGSHTALT